MGHYNNQFPLNKKGNGVKHIVARTIVGVEEDPSQFNIVFSMDSCLSSTTMSSVGWYVNRWRFEIYNI
jgi:hypothetical protein